MIQLSVLSPIHVGAHCDMHYYVEKNALIGAVTHIQSEKPAVTRIGSHPHLNSYLNLYLDPSLKPVNMIALHNIKNYICR